MGFLNTFLNPTPILRTAKAFASLTLLLCFITVSDLRGQCTISGPPFVDLGQSTIGNTAMYFVTFDNLTSCSSVTTAWNGTNLGTINIVNCDTVAGKLVVDVMVTFNRLDGNSVLNVGGCTLQITLLCTPITPSLSMVNSFLCGNATPINFSISTAPDNITSFNFNGTIGGTTNSAPSGPTGVTGNITPNSGCVPGMDLVFTYTSACGTTTANKKANAALTVSNITGANALCNTGTNTVGTYSANIAGFPNGCITPTWEISPANSGLVITGTAVSNGVTTMTAQANQPGTYTVKLRVNGCSLTEVTRVFSVLVTSNVPNIPTSPPSQLQYVCTGENEVCYNFANFNVSDFDISTTDNKLVVDQTGSTICLSSIWFKRRMSTIAVTPINGCGAGTTRFWNIFIDFPQYCPNGWGLATDDEPTLPSVSYNISSNGSQLRIEDIESTSTQEKVGYVYSLNGQFIHSFVTDQDVYEMELPGTMLSGIYIVRILKGSDVYTEKIFLR